MTTYVCVCVIYVVREVRRGEVRCVDRHVGEKVVSGGYEAGV